MKCPLCNGKGFYYKKFEEQEKELKSLRNKGLTYREIMKITGIKSLDSIHYYLVRGRKQGRWHNRKWYQKLFKEIL